MGTEKKNPYFCPSFLHTVFLLQWQAKDFFQALMLRKASDALKTWYFSTNNKIFLSEIYSQYTW